MNDIVRVLRVIEYVGYRDWVEETVSRSIHGIKEVKPGCLIRAATLTEYPEILSQTSTGTQQEEER